LTTALNGAIAWNSNSSGSTQIAVDQPDDRRQGRGRAATINLARNNSDNLSRHPRITNWGGGQTLQALRSASVNSADTEGRSPWADVRGREFGQVDLGVVAMAAVELVTGVRAELCAARCASPGATSLESDPDMALIAFTAASASPAPGPIPRTSIPYTTDEESCQDRKSAHTSTSKSSRCRLRSIRRRMRAWRFACPDGNRGAEQVEAVVPDVGATQVFAGVHHRPTRS
jgi:hypothetical protein